MANAKNQLDLTTGSVTKKLLAFVLPYICGMVMQQLYSFVGVLIVSNFSADGATALAAVGSTGNLTSMLIGFFTGLSLGANVLCANHIGAKDTQKTRDTMHCALPICLLCGLFVLVVGIVGARPILVWMNTPDTVIEHSVLYLRIYFWGAPFSLLYNTGAAIMRAHGDTKRPTTILTVSGIVNVVCNIIFVVCFRMSVAGVAWSTVCAQAVSAGCALYILFSPRDLYKLSPAKLRLQPQIAIAILRIGVPSGFNTIVFHLSGVVLQGTLNTFGEVAMAGQSAANSITLFLHTVPNSFYAACTSFAGQCYGAKNYRRIDKMVASGIGSSLLLSTVLAVLTTFLQRPLIGIFNGQPDIIDAGIPYLLILGWGNVLYGIPSVFMGCLQGMQKSAVNAMSNFICICLFRIFWVYVIFPLKPTLVMLNLSYPASFLLSSIVLGTLYLFTRRSHPKETCIVQ